MIQVERKILIRLTILIFIIFFYACSPTSNKEIKNFLIPLVQGNSSLPQNSFTSNPEERPIDLDQNPNILEENPIVIGENAAIFEERPFVFGENPLHLEWSTLLEIPSDTIKIPNVAIDGNGFIYVASDSNANLIGNELKIGTRDVILKKYDSRQNELWMKRIGSRNTSLIITGLAADRNGNAYVTGYTNGPLEKALISDQDMFLVKFNPDGTIAWKKQAAPKRARGVYNTYKVFTEGITVDIFGNSYVVGTSNGPFGDNANGNLDGGYIIKFDTNGNQIWVKQISIVGASIYPKKVAVDESSGQIYVAGISNNANFRTNKTFNYSNGVGGDDLFILRFNENGNQEFFTQTNLYRDRITLYSLTVDSLGNVLVGGSSFIDLEFGTHERTSLRGILIKYDLNGDQRWIRQFGPRENVRLIERSTTVTGVATDENGNIFTTGSTNGNIINEHSEPLGNQDIFLTKYNYLGQIEWIRQIGRQGETLYPGGIGIDFNGDLYTTGLTDDNGKDYQVIGGNLDLFLMRFR
ncbi:SBBP repeat beta-propeller lipoprotein, LipL53 family [Leptospira kirschneri]|uniref:SBBP repeat beta-propeller lipoprotein, LipL53 family n=1 Tax=Leptospira kirschneri TaxID=29507 RepID=UPI000297C661|nr:SBBP repeat-containing protein [Leptospira kirschneri]EKR09582.1 beta-propeller repeat protein [Leptospira kirschneri serovar Valbuzzi str. 200702274]UZW35805.1 SBBP repeat-containing protein [Leptospira kirschneri]WHO99506.1 SBBP repeat-containing protein [Leptospira kirschneri]